MSDEIEPVQVDEEIAEYLGSMTKGQYLLLVMAIRKLGGELRVDPRELARMATEASPRMTVDGTDGAVVLRLT